MLLNSYLRLVLFTAIYFFAVRSYAQQPDSVVLTSSDTLSIKTKLQRISTKLKHDSIYSGLVQSLTAHEDSLQRIKLTLNKDSLKTDSLKQWYHQHQASIVSLALSQKEKRQRLDSLKISYDKGDALLKQEQQKHLVSINEKQTMMNAQLSKWKEKWNVLLRPLDSLNAGKTEVSSLSDASGNNTASFSGDRSLNVPNSGIPSAELPSLETGQLSLPNDVAVPDVAVPEMPSLESFQEDLAIPEVQQIQEKFKQIEALETSISHYKKDLDSLDREKAAKKVETIATEQVKKLEEVNAIEKSKGMTDAEMQKIQQYESMMRQYQDKDKEYIAQQMEQKSKQVANNLLKEKAPQLQEAQKQLTASQKKYKTFSSLSDAKKHRLNALHGKPFRDRFFYGMSLQFQKQQQQDVFFVPQAYYRLTGRLSAGVGVTYRTQFQTKPDFEWMNTNTLWGGRTFLKIGLAKGLFLHGEYERLSLKQQDVSAWSGRWMAGAGKSFRVSKRVKGEALVLNNFSHKNDKIYYHQINVRTAFFLGKSLR